MTYWPHTCSKIDKINHYFLFMGSPYEAQSVQGSEELVAVTGCMPGPVDFLEVYLIEELLEHLKDCCSTEEIRKVLEESGLAV